MSIQTLKEELVKLSKLEQTELLHFMVELLTNDDFELSEDWKKELDRREEALKNRTSVGQPASDILSKYKPR
jgi:hypothetical protein